MTGHPNHQQTQKKPCHVQQCAAVCEYLHLCMAKSVRPAAGPMVALTFRLLRLWRPCAARSSHVPPYAAVRGPVPSYAAICNHIRKHMQPYAAVCHYSVHLLLLAPMYAQTITPSASTIVALTFHSLQQLYAARSGHVRPHAAVLGHVRPYAPIRNHGRPYATI